MRQMLQHGRAIPRVQSNGKDVAASDQTMLRRIHLKPTLAAWLALGAMSLPVQIAEAAEFELPSTIAGVYNLNGAGYIAVLTDIVPTGTLNVGSTGSVRVFAARTLKNQGILNNTGRISITQVSTLSNFGTLTNNGEIVDFLTVGANAQIFRNELGATLRNNGLLSFTTNIKPENLGTLINNGSLLVRVPMTNSGALTLAAGSSFVYSRGELTNSGTLTLAAGSNFDFSGATLNNGGTIHLQRNFTFGAAVSGTVKLNAGGTVVNSALLTNSAGHWQDGFGTLNNQSGKSFVNSGFYVSHGNLVNAGTLSNSGLLSLQSGSNFNFTGGTLNNTGDFELKRNFSLGAARAGTVNLNAAGKLRNYGILTNIAGHTQANAGTLYNAGGSTFNNVGTFNTSGLIENDGTLTSTGSLVNAGTLLNRQGTLNLAVGSSYNFTGGTLSNSGTLNLQRNFTLGGAIAGTVNLNAGGTLNNAAVLTNRLGHSQSNAGVLNNQTGATLANHGALANSGVLTNAGTFTSAGMVSGTGSFTQTAGVSQIDGSLIQSQVSLQGGQLFGSGTIASAVVNDAGVMQAGAPGAPGALGIDGSFVQRAAGTLRALIGGTAAGQSSRIAVGGPLSLAGTLDLDAVNGYSFAAGDSHTLLTFQPGTLTGTFDNVVYGALAGQRAGLAIGPGLVLDVVYDNSLGHVQLNVTAAVPEPATWAMMVLGFGIIGGLAGRRRAAAAVQLA